MSKIIEQKTWLTIEFYKGEARIELSMNYHTKKYSLSHGSNDNNVTFGRDEDIQKDLDRADLVKHALKFVKQELFT